MHDRLQKHAILDAHYWSHCCILMDNQRTVHLAAQQGDNPAMIAVTTTKDMEFADFAATQQARNDIQLNVRKYTLMLCDALADNFKSRNKGKVGGYDAPTYKFYIEEGRKYHKIVMEYETGQKSVHAFVDKKTGERLQSSIIQSTCQRLVIVFFHLLVIKEREWLL